MYTTTRQAAADILGISTRSIDRYVKAGKLRCKKEGKIIYIHSQDIQNLSGIPADKKTEVIFPKEQVSSYTQKVTPSVEMKTHQWESQENQSRATLEKIYLDLRQEIKQKDQALQELSLRLGQAQEIAKNSVSLIEFKKSQFLLEESKSHITQELEILRDTELELKKKLKYEKSTNALLIAFCIALILW
jgi:predicted site-specific integrase-resolvase